MHGETRVRGLNHGWQRTLVLQAANDSNEPFVPKFERWLAANLMPHSQRILMIFLQAHAINENPAI